MAAGTCVILEENAPSMSVKKIKFSFTAGTGGDVNSIGSAQTSSTYNGKILGVTTVEGTGSSACSASYDITLKDESSVDVMMSAGLSRSSGTSHTLSGSMGAIANDKLTLGINGTGVSNTGDVYVFIR